MQEKKKVCEKEYLNTPLWDSSLSLEKRLDALLEAMTEEEKIACMTTGCPDIPRLGIRSFFLGGEAAHGIEARHDQAFNRGEPQPSTSFPQPVGMSAAWDRALMEEIGTAVGEEARVIYQNEGGGGLCRWAPTIDMERDPRWGRTEEAYGEDPLLTGEMAGGYIRGMRGDDPFYLRCGATLKHFYANNQEKDRIRTSSSLDPRNKREYYLEPFRIAVEAGAEAVMTSYNEINGVPAIVNPEVQELLKDTWGLPGHVVCDGGDMQQTVTDHGFFSSHAETVAYGLKAGVDCFTDDKEAVEQAVREALERGLITWDDINRSVRNSFRTRIRLGLYDGQGENPYGEIPEERLNSPMHGRLARQAVRESAVLLKNEAVKGFGAQQPENEAVKGSGVQQLENEAVKELEEPLLPLKKGRKVAVIGPWADAWYKDWYSGIPPYAVTVAEGIRRSGMAGEVRSLDGYDRIRIRTEDGYLCAQQDGTLKTGSRENAEIFRLEDWGCGQFLLFGEGVGRYLVTGEDMRVTVSSKEAFGWFIREAFHFRSPSAAPGESAAVLKYAVEPQSGAPVFMESWNGRLLELDGGQLSCRPEQKEDWTEGEMSRQNCGGPGKKPEKFWLEQVSSGTAEAMELAEWADVVIYAAGGNPVINSKEEIDRETLALPEAQERQLFALKERNPGFVLLLIANYPYAIVREQRELPAIVQCASGSQELGNGLADLLFGKVSFAGRLPMTWYRSTEDLPPMEDYDIIRGKRTYQYFEGETLYPFGCGLSYTSFAYSDLKLHMTSGGDNPNDAGRRSLFVSFTVENTGAVVSDEVVQIYVRQNGSRAARPRKQLRAFERLKDLRPGECRPVIFEIPLDSLRYYDVVTEQMVLETGSYTVMAGASSEDIRLEQTVEISGTEIPPRNAERTIRADHYDDCRNILLYQGHDAQCAVYAKSAGCRYGHPERNRQLEKTLPDGEMIYRDMVFAAAPECIHVLLQGEGAGQLEVLLGVPGGGERILLRTECENGGKPVWKEFSLNTECVENFPLGKRTEIRIRLKGCAGVAAFAFSPKICDLSYRTDSDT